MYFYLLPATGDGTDEAPYSAPVSGSWVGTHFPDTDEYLFATPEPLDGETALTDAELAALCEERGLNLADVLTWSVGAPAEEPPPVEPDLQ